MKILFDKSNTGPQELELLTGSYYANNNFQKVYTDILLETEKIIELIGEEVYLLAENFYHIPPQGSSPDPVEVSKLTLLLQHIQLPIALMAAYRFYQSNIMSHEDSGRKLKVDKDKEATPWEWMLDRDDDAQLRKAYTAIDRLIRFLDKSNFPEWKNSEKQKASRNLFINNSQAFHNIYPIDDSPRFFYAVLPFIAEIQRKTIYKALGQAKYLQLLEVFQSIPNQSGSSPLVISESDETLLTLIQQAIPLLTMAMAVKRLSIKILPEGVVQQFKSMLVGRSASQPALADVIKIYADQMSADAQFALNELKKEINKTNTAAQQYQLTANNSENNKYFRT